MNERGTSDRGGRRHGRPAYQGPAIEASNVVKDFGDHRALDAIDLTVETGTIVGLIGPSGCGKSTLVRILLGILAPTSGEVRIFGGAPGDLSIDDRNRMAYMPQLPVLFPNLTVGGNLDFVASLYGVPYRGRRRRVKELLELVDLTPHRSKRLADCSGGMQRRVSLAATLAHDPDLLFLDEPTAGVDPILRERFWARFRELRNEGHTIVVPTQYVGEAVSCDRVAIMSDGRIIAADTPDALRRKAFDGTPMQLRLEQGWLPAEQMDLVAGPSFVHTVRRMDDDLLVVVDDEHRDPPLLRQHLEQLGLRLVSLEPIEASFDQIFVELIERDRSATADAEDMSS